MKCRHNDGFSLVEMLVAIAILGLIAVPASSGMLTAVRINTKTEELLQAQLAVSSTVETLMATGISGEFEISEKGMTVKAVKDEEHPYYAVTVSYGTVEVQTHIRAAEQGGGNP